MRDLDNSLNFNFSRFHSTGGWHNLPLDDCSQEVSLLNKNAVSVHQVQQNCLTLLKEPPRPSPNIYGCIESDQSDSASIKEVSYAQNEPEAKHVNSKQYFRMMKRRIKKVLMAKATDEKHDTGHSSTLKKKYMHESRHRHASVRPRGNDGKFLATRPETERFREKKKRGRKPKKDKEPEKQTTTPSQTLPGAEG